LTRIQALEAAAADELGISRQRFLFELQEAAALAKSKGDPAAMVAAWREIGKACGFYTIQPIRVDLNVKGQVEMRRLNQMTDAQLLALITNVGAGGAARV
jgi:hypothetical protein